MATIKIKNSTNYNRTGVVTLGVPFAKADNISASDTLVVANAYSSNNSNQRVQWTPVGARWDNGAVKYAKVSFTSDLSANQEKTANLFKSSSSTSTPFNISNSLFTNLLSTIVVFTVEGYSYQLNLANVMLIEGGSASDHYARFRLFTHLPQTANPVTRHFWVDLVVDLFNNLDAVQFYFRYGFYRFLPDITPSHPEAIPPAFRLGSPITLRIDGPITFLRFQNESIESVITTSDTNKTFVLLDPVRNDGNNAKICAGMSGAYKGTLVFGALDGASKSAESESQILAICSDWKTLYPITNKMPDDSRHPYLTSQAEKLTRSNTLLNTVTALVTNAIRKGPRLFPPLANDPDCKNTGTHGFRDYAFGLRGWPIFSCDNYNWIPYLEYNTRQQSMRSNWYYTDTGTPVEPDDLQAADVHIWHGRMFSTAPASYAGYSRAIGESELATGYRTNNTAGLVLGPDKEHYTNLIILLQAIISMDWFSLEYIKMYTKFWIYGNRTDAFPTYAISGIHNWGSPRAIGRGSQNAAFLYELTADPELKQLIEDRYNFNVNIRGRLTREHVSGDYTQKIYGTEVLGVCNLPACLGGFRHWRPWEEGAAAFGNYLLAKSLLAEDPSSTIGQKYLNIARDASASIVLGNCILDCTDGNSDAIGCFTVGPAPAHTGDVSPILQNFITNIGFALNRTVIGQTSGATATLVLTHYSNEYGNSFRGRYLTFWLRNVTGTFQVGETIRLDTGLICPYPIYEKHKFWGAMSQNLEMTQDPNNFGNLLTLDNALEISTSQDANYPTAIFPFGYFRNARYSRSYPVVMSPAIVIALEASLQNFYTNNNELIKTKAQTLFDRLTSNNISASPTDFDETLDCFMGYIGNFTQQQNTVVNLNINTNVIVPVANEPTITITDYIVNANTTNVSSSSIRATIYDPSVQTSTIISAYVKPAGLNLLVSTIDTTASAGATKVTTTSSTIVASTEVHSVTSTVLVKQNRKYVWIYMGDLVLPTDVERDAPIYVDVDTTNQDATDEEVQEGDE